MKKWGMKKKERTNNSNTINNNVRRTSGSFNNTKQLGNLSGKKMVTTRQRSNTTTKNNNNRKVKTKTNERTKSRFNKENVSEILPSTEKKKMMSSPTGSILRSPDRKKNQKKSNKLSSQTLQQLDNWNTQLHISCLLHYPESEIIQMILLDNALLFRKNSSGDLPIHYACLDKFGVQSNILDLLVQGYPQSVRMCNSDRCLPLHLACMVGAPSLYAITLLILVYPESVMCQSEFQVPFPGTKPLQPPDNNKQTTISSGGFNEDTLMELYDSENITEIFNEFMGFPEDPKKEKKHISGHTPLEMETGWSPLHLAITNFVDPRVTSLIVNADPRCIGSKTDKGRTPIDCAMALVNEFSSRREEHSIHFRNTMESLGIMRTKRMDILDDYDEYGKRSTTNALVNALS